MHPLLSTKRNFLLYLAVWVPVGCFFGLMLSISSGLSWVEAACVVTPLAFADALLCLGPWFGCRMIPAKGSDVPRMLVNHIAAGLVAAGAWTYLAREWVTLLSHYFRDLGERLHGQLPSVFESGFLMYMLSVALHYVLFSVQSSREAESREQEARVLAREAELKALKAQINPHFLFNSLNSISALATTDGKRAREMCIRLSEFLRSTLSLGEKENISLDEELALAKAYLNVEQIRFGPRLKVEESVSVHCHDCTVPPLLLQPLVENAVKHGIAGLVEGGIIRVRAECVDSFLRVRVENEFDPEMPAARRSGLGLVNVRNRLRARYDDQARLDTASQGNFYSAELVLPCPVHHENGVVHA